MNSHEQYLSLYEEQRGLLALADIPALEEARPAAAALLRRFGLPDTAREEYKYTNAAEAFAPNYGVNLRRVVPEGGVFGAIRCPLPDDATQTAFFRNDIPVVAEPAWSDSGEPVVCTFGEARQRFPSLLTQHYNRLAAQEADTVAALNTLLAQDGLFVYFPQGCRAAKPVQVVMQAASRVDLLMVRRLIVVMEEGARGSVLLCTHADGGDARLTADEVVEVFVGKKAELDLYCIEDTRERYFRFLNLFAVQEEESRVALFSSTLRCGLSRLTAHVRLAGQGARLEATGMLVASSRQHADTHLHIDHDAPDTESQLLYKSVLDEQATGAFAGMVRVSEGAVRTLSSQTSANLCVSPDARAWAQPMLEIYADDVRCNHGATIGKLDEQALFYMQQRGIAEQEARLLLQHAFVNEVLTHIRLAPLAERLSELVAERFRVGKAQCAICQSPCIMQHS